MSAWETGASEQGQGVLMSRADAIVAIKKMAKDMGYNKFRVHYDGDEREASELPEQVDMSLVTLSAMLNNA